MEIRKIRLLLVEDNPADARLLREFLKEARTETFEVEVASTLSVAVERLGAKPFEVALIDLSLPDSQGLETFDRVREATGRIPLIVLTGLEDEDLALRAVQRGAQDYLYKRDLHADGLIRSVRYALRREEMLRALELNSMALQASEDRYRTLVDGVDAVVWEADPERRKFSFVSHRVESLFGFRVDDWTDTEGFWQDLVHSADLDGVREKTRVSVAARADHVAEYRLKTGDGRWLWVRDLVHVEVDAQGSPRAISGVMIDVTELIALQQYRENLIDVISHEFRTPITLIQGYAQLLTAAEQKLSPEQAANARERIDEATMHLSYLLGTITELARIREGGVPVHRERVPTRALIEEAVALMSARGRALEGIVRVEVAPRLEEVLLDRRKVLISLVELLDNAAKFSPKGAPILVRVRSLNGEVVLSVEDRGPGIPQDVQRRIFQPFTQADMSSVRKVGGAGLGLAVVAGLVRSQGGRVELESTPGQGAVFRIILAQALP